MARALGVWAVLLVSVVRAVPAFAGEGLVARDSRSGLCSILPPSEFRSGNNQVGVRGNDLFYVSRSGFRYEGLVKAYLKSDLSVAQALVYFHDAKKNPEGMVESWVACDTARDLLAALNDVVYRRNAPADPCKTSQGGTVPLTSELERTIQSTKPLLIAGGVDGSGGDATRSTVDQVHAAAQNLKEKLRLGWTRALLTLATGSPQGFDREFGSGAYDRVLALAKGNGTSPSLLDALKDDSIKIEWKEDGPCHGDGDIKDASAVGKDGKGTICMSVPRLQRLSPESLDIEIAALASHEVSHLFGFNEPDAQKLQEIVRTNRTSFYPPTEILLQIADRRVDLSNRLTQVQLDFVEHAPDSSLCMHLGQLFNAADRDIQILRSTRLPNPAGLSLLMEVSTLSAAQGYCLDKPELVDAYAKANIVKKGDRQALFKALNDYSNLLLESSRVFGAFLDPDSEAKRYVPTHNSRARIDMMATPEYAKLKGIAADQVKPADGQDIVCDETETNGQFTTKYTSRAQPFYSNADGTLYITQARSLMIRKNTGRDMIDVMVMQDSTKNAKVKNGFLTTDEDGKHIIPASGLIWGANESVEFEYDKTKDGHTVHCTAVCSLKKR